MCARTVGLHLTASAAVTAVSASSESGWCFWVLQTLPRLRLLLTCLAGQLMAGLMVGLCGQLTLQLPAAAALPPADVSAPAAAAGAAGH